jgi:hypothetical protein
MYIKNNSYFECNEQIGHANKHIDAQVSCGSNITTMQQLDFRSSFGPAKWRIKETQIQIIRVHTFTESLFIPSLSIHSQCMHSWSSRSIFLCIIWTWALEPPGIHGAPVLGLPPTIQGNNGSASRRDEPCTGGAWVAPARQGSTAGFAARGEGTYRLTTSAMTWIGVT